MISNQMSMLRLCTLDPSKYGWTAIGGISTNLLVPHEMARRPEAREKFLKQRSSATTTTTSSESNNIGNGGGGGNVDESSSKYYTITDPSSLTLSSSVSSSNHADAVSDNLNAAALAGAAVGTTAAAVATDDANNSANKSTKSNALKEIVIHAITTTTNTTTANRKKSNDNNTKADDDHHPPRSSSPTKPSPLPNTPYTSKPSSPIILASTATTGSTNTNLDIYTYHRGRVGQEPRNPSTGALLCDMDPVDTNYGWVPGKSAVCKVTINFPLGDLNDDDDDDSDDNNDREDLAGKQGGCGDEFTMLDSRRRGINAGGMPENYVRPSRTSRSSAGGISGSGGLASTAASTASTDNATTLNHPQVPRFVQVIDWDLANPHTPTPELYATSIASEFGLSFPQTMDLMESIERQLRAFCASQPMFYAPMAILDPYGCERPDAHFGPPEIHCGPVLSSATTSYVVRRMNSNHSIGRGGGAGGSSSNSRRVGGSSASRPMGAVKPDKRGIHVVPKDQLVLPNKEGDAHVAEVLQRAKSRSMAMVVECGKKGEVTLTTTKNEVCHICHNRKECGLTFHCGVHNYCDFHCATRLGFRVSDYDSSQPLNLPINFCPVCALICLCAKCTRRLEEVSNLLRKESQKQNVGPKDTIMDNVFELCSFKLKNDVNVTAKPSSSSSASGAQRSNKDKGSSKKVKIEQTKENKLDGKKIKRRRSSGSVTHNDDDVDDAAEVPRKISSRSMRSSPSSDAVVDERPHKKRKFEKSSAVVSVLKVPPSAFPKEMCRGKDLDPSTPEDMNMVFSPDGVIPMNESAMPSLGCSQKYQDLIPPYVAESHFYHCIECGKYDGTIVLCKECPRAYHEKCLGKSKQSSPAVEDSGGSDVATVSSELPVRHLTSPCHRCECDRRAIDSEEEENPETKINESKCVTNIGMILEELHQILKKLIDYDYGFVFADPVNTKEITDYLQVITKPMDYRTISSKLETRQYVTSDDDLSKKCSGLESLNDMEKMLLQAVVDIMQVHHNCFLYNPEGSSFYRAGKVQERKWNALFNKLTKTSFPELVLLQLARFREDCDDERKRTRRTRHFEAKNEECTPIAVFDPDTKRIVKQYSSWASAKSAAILLGKMGYACESALTSTNAKTRLEYSKDPMRPLFGYQWLPTEELKRGLFEFKPYFRSDDLVSPTPNNIVVLKSDVIVGDNQLQRGFESEDAAYRDWLNEKSKSFTLSTFVDKQDTGEEESRTEFVTNYLDGNRSINGLVWNRVDNQGINIAPKLSPKSTGKVVMDEEHAEEHPAPMPTLMRK